jgi:psp operon transcriptional activator
MSISDQDPYSGFSRESDESSSQPTITEALGESEEFLSFQENLSKVAGIERPVLILGERGTGKELAAFRLHFLSKRWGNSFVAVNCAALSPSILESELFGHEAGSFTGATRRRKGRFEAADGGTLFLDEIGQTPIAVQEKILRAVEYGSFERVGNSTPIEVDVRIIGATNTDLFALAEAGKFKQDLLDRLSFEVLFLPPLRHRQEDIILLSNHFAARMAFELGMKSTPVFSKNAIAQLNDYPWPGNVRELKNVIERAVYRSSNSRISEITFNPFQSPFRSGLTTSPISDAPSPESGKSAKATPAPSFHGNLDFAEAIRELELHLLKESLRKSHFNQRKAADLLKLTYHQFRGLYRRYADEVIAEGEEDQA